MALRFRKSFKVAPGLRLNVGKSGFSGISLGPRGSSMSIGKKGVYGNVGLPIPGASIRTRLDDNTKHRTKLTGAYGDYTADDIQNMTDGQFNKFQKVSDAEEKLNKYEDLLELVLWPHRLIGPTVENFSFTAPPPPPPPKFILTTPQAIGTALALILFGILAPLILIIGGPVLIIGWIESRKEAKKWTNEKAHHDDLVAAEKLFQACASGDLESMSNALGLILLNVSWLAKGSADFIISNDAKAVALDIDFPEIEDIPNFNLVYRKTSDTFDKKAKKDGQVRTEYAGHLCSVALKIAWEVFRLLPTVENILLGGYTQRANKATGHMDDDYVLSVIFDRNKWKSLNASAADPWDCVGLFNVRRELGKDKILSKIEPFSFTDISEKFPENAQSVDFEAADLDF